MLVSDSTREKWRAAFGRELPSSIRPFAEFEHAVSVTNGTLLAHADYMVIDRVPLRATEKNKRLSRNSKLRKSMAKRLFARGGMYDEAFMRQLFRGVTSQRSMKGEKR